MPHALSSDLGTGYFHTALVADNTLKTHLFVFAAETFVVFGRTKDPLAEKSVSFRFQGAVVNSFRFGHFAVRPASDLFRRS